MGQAPSKDVATYVGKPEISAITTFDLGRRDMFHRIVSVKPADDMGLIVHFVDNINKFYDVKPLMKLSPPFEALNVPTLFKQVRVDAGGYGVSWNDELDISCNELWERGQILP